MSALDIFGENIRKVREYNHISLLELSKRVNYDRQELSTLENSEHDCRLSTAIKIVKALDRNFAEMFSRNFEVKNEHPYLEDDYYTIYTNNILQLLKEQRKNQYFISTRVGSTPENVNRILKQRVDPGIKTLEKIGTTLDRDLPYLFTRKER